MDPIIRAATVAARPRRLRAPGAPHLVVPAVEPHGEAGLQPAQTSPGASPARDAQPVHGADGADTGAGNASATAGHVRAGAPQAPAAAPATAVQPDAVLAQAIAAERERVRAELQAEQQAWIAAAEQAQRDWVAQAEAQRSAWREQAEQELRAAYGEAERRGLEDGAAQAQRVAEDLVQAQVARLQAAAAALLQAQTTLAPALQEDAVELAFTIVCRVLGEQAATRAGINAMLQVQLAALRERRDLTVRLHPADCALMASAEVDGGAALRYVPDTGIELGGCLIDSPAGTLDARLEYQLGQLRQALAAARAGEA
jgi:flagellar assembly protein FliH